MSAMRTKRGEHWQEALSVPALKQTWLDQITTPAIHWQAHALQTPQPTPANKSFKPMNITTLSLIFTCHCSHFYLSTVASQFHLNIAASQFLQNIAASQFHLNIAASQFHLPTVASQFHLNIAASQFYLPAVAVNFTWTLQPISPVASQFHLNIAASQFHLPTVANQFHLNIAAIFTCPL